MKPEEKTRPICPPNQSGKSVFFCGRKQPGCKRQRSTKEGDFCALAGFQRAAALGDSLVTFSSGRKSPGCRAERLHLRGCGGKAPHLGEQEPSLTTCSRGGHRPLAPSVEWNPTDPTPSGRSPDPETPACCKASSPADSLGKPPGGTAWPAGRPQTATQKSGGRSPCRGSRG